jgi:hypothetical protein
VRSEIRRKEKSIETAFVRWVGTLENWYAWKFSPDGTRGLPDRIVLGPGGTIFFIEFKRPGEKPTRLQSYIHGILKDLGFDVYVCDDAEKAKKILRRYI